MCKTPKVSASGYYDWQGRAPSKREQANAALTQQIHQAFVASDETYGMPRIRAELFDDGIVATAVYRVIAWATGEGIFVGGS